MQEVINYPLPYDKITLLKEVSYYVSYSRYITYPNDPKLDDIHIHDNYEIYFHISGKASMFINDTVYSLTQGDVIISAPGDIHVFIPEEKTEAEHFCLWFDEECGSELLSFLKNDTHFNKLSFESAFFESLKEILFELYDNSCNTSNLKKMSDILKLSLMLNDKAEEKNICISDMPPHIEAIVNYIDIHKCEISRIRHIADEFNISVATLNRWFKSYIGVSPGEFLNAKRISYAKKLLDNGETVTESAIKSGFSDCSYFIATFKKRLGITPFQYKKTREHI